MKKLLGIIIFYLLFNNIAYAKYFDLNECFYFKRSGLVQNNTWNEYNNKKWRGIDPKFDKEGKGHKIYVYEGEKFDCGSKQGFVEATIAISLRDEEIKDDCKSP